MKTHSVEAIRPATPPLLRSNSAGYPTGNAAICWVFGKGKHAMTGCYMCKADCYSANLPVKIQGFARYSAATPPLLRRLLRRKPYETWTFVTKTHGLLRDPWRVAACDVYALLGRNAIHPVLKKET